MTEFISITEVNVTNLVFDDSLQETSRAYDAGAQENARA